MKIAVAGKGGTGKTTIAAALARTYAAEGRDVLAIDIDPDANLGSALGFSDDDLAGIIPVTEMRELVLDASAADELGKIYRPGARIAEIPDRFAKEVGGMRLLLLGGIDAAGRGCKCPEHTLVRRIVGNLALAPGDTVIMDMEAGLEHLARGTADGADAFVIVVEPGARSAKTYRDAKRLAGQLGIGCIGVVANKVRSEADEEFVRGFVPESELMCFIPWDESIMEADRSGTSPCDASAALMEGVAVLKAHLEG